MTPEQKLEILDRKYEVNWEGELTPQGWLLATVERAAMPLSDDLKSPQKRPSVRTVEREFRTSDDKKLTIFGHQFRNAVSMTDGPITDGAGRIEGSIWNIKIESAEGDSQSYNLYAADHSPSRVSTPADYQVTAEGTNRLLEEDEIRSLTTAVLWSTPVGPTEYSTGFLLSGIVADVT